MNECEDQRYFCLFSLVDSSLRNAFLSLSFHLPIRSECVKHVRSNTHRFVAHTTAQAAADQDCRLREAGAIFLPLFRRSFAGIHMKINTHTQTQTQTQTQTRARARTHTHTHTHTHAHAQVLNSNFNGAARRWAGFTVWGAGRDGRQFVGLLSPAARQRVVAMCDVDPKKIGGACTCLKKCTKNAKGSVHVCAHSDCLPQA